MYGVVCVILCLAIFVQYRHVTDRQMNGRTHDDSMYHASIASHGKQVAQLSLTNLRYFIYILKLC